MPAKLERMRHHPLSLSRRVLPIPIALLAGIACAQFPGASTTPPPADLKRGWDSISIPEAKEIDTFLATQCDGRGSGAPGFQKAADFVAAHFKAWGLKPLGDKGTYFQEVPFNVTHFEDDGSSIDVIGSSTTIKAGSAFRFITLNTPLNVTTVMAVVRPTKESIDVTDANLEGRIVLVLADNPSPAILNSIARQSPAAVLTTAAVVPPASYSAVRAQTGQAGAVAGNRGRGGGRGARAPMGNLTPKAATELLAAVELIPEDTSHSQGATIQFSKGFVHVQANVQTKLVGVPNVVAMLEGSDPVLRNQYIGIGGHLDHLGRRGNVIYPGADDDGSGATAVLCIAHAMVTNPVKPKRSVILMTFCGEELGLIGSSWYADHPARPHDKMVAELQMDMVARDSYGPQNGDQRRIDVEKDNLDTIRLVGSKRISTELDKTIQEVNRCIGFRFKYDAEDVYTRSDHYNFAKHGIPIAFLFDGFTPDYHQPTDTVDKIDFLKLTNAAKLYYLTAYAVGAMPDPPKHDVAQ
jgi:hypothetical protein